MDRNLKTKLSDDKTAKSELDTIIKRWGVWTDHNIQISNNVFTLQDNAQTLDPTDTMTFSQFGITAFDVQYWNGASWITVPGGSITANNRVWRKLTFSSVQTTRVRVLVNNSLGGYSRVIELEAWGP